MTGAYWHGVHDLEPSFTGSISTQCNKSVINTYIINVNPSNETFLS